MSKSVYEFWLSQDKEKLRFPILPETLDIKNSTQNETVRVSKFGELTFLDKAGAKIFSFSSFFPKDYSPLAEYSGFPSPENAIKTIEKWLDSEKPIQFLVTGTKINFKCSIDAFDHGEGQKDIGDHDFDITLKEFKMASPRKIKQKKKTQQTRPSKSSPKSHKVKRGDTLWALAGKYYSDSTQWRKIWEANKTMMIKRDKRNIRQPGHWIFPGQTLKIP
ncbi:LysM peptidoglycan-binding domain-containing protein [Terribacillus saccharophilus]|uniref:LysM peptidoglycan-binding domain-containing protein n=1 Tax=Terribacillus saccharophilus TaxID=361277 RepID=UPI003D296F49